MNNGFMEQEWHIPLLVLKPIYLSFAFFGWAYEKSDELVLSIRWRVGEFDEWARSQDEKRSIRSLERKISWNWRCHLACIENPLLSEDYKESAERGEARLRRLLELYSDSDSDY